MARQARWGVTLVLLLGLGMAARAQQSYLDETVIHVKPGKGAAWEAMVKKVVAANRDHKGDTWVALQTAYGEGDTVRFVSVRQSYAETEKASDAFDAAMDKAMGHAAAEKLFADLADDTTESRNTLLLRRPDLSSNFPADAAAEAKIVGSTRWIRIIRIVLRSGQGLRFEDLAKQVKAAQEKADPNLYSWVSQSVAGESAGVYYVAQLRSSLAGFDGETPMPQIMGNDAYLNMLKTASEIIQSESITLGVFRPELSNPPEGVVNVAPNFWRPKPAAPKPATKPAPAKK